MKANHNNNAHLTGSVQVVLNILKEQNESKSQLFVEHVFHISGCFKYPQRTK